MKKETNISTKAVYAGEKRVNAEHTLTTPIFQTSTYTFENTADLTDFMEARLWGEAGERHEYARYGNPTVHAAEQKIAALENAEDTCLFSSGMAAITSTLMTLLSAGKHIIFTDDSYRRTRELIESHLKRFGVSSTCVPMGNFAALEAAIQPNTAVIFSESPTNPYLRVLDLEKLVAIAKPHGIKTVIDSTFATPINQRPLEFGVDVVIHSATKYLGGHNDVMAGAVCGSEYLLAAVRQAQGVFGAVCDPHAAYLLLRGMKTLSLRVHHQNDTARRLAEFLQGHPAIKNVYYPALPSHPDHAIATAQMTGFGGVVSFELDTDFAGTGAFIDRLEIPFIAPSLGGVESLVEQVALVSYFELSTEERAALGIADSLVRLAVGIEDAAEIIADVARALDHVFGTTTLATENGFIVMSRP